MLRLILAFILFFSPAFSQTSSRAWDGSTLRIVPSKTHYADILYDNQVSIGTSPSIYVLTLDDGLDFHVVIHGDVDDNKFDTIYVYPPVGYSAFPEQITFPDGEIGIIEIHQIGLS